MPGEMITTKQMPAYQRRRIPLFSKPEAFMGSMARLLGEQNKSLQGVGDAVEGYGQSRAGGKLAELMGEDGFDKLSPEQAQAAAMERTGGRTLNKRGENMLSTMMRNKQNTLDNQNKVDAADVLFGRQNSQIGQRHANALAQEAGRQKNRLSLGRQNGTVDGVNKLFGEKDVVRLKDEVRNYDEALLNKKLTPFQKAEILKAKDASSYMLQKGLTGDKGLTLDMKNEWGTTKNSSRSNNRSNNVNTSAVPKDIVKLSRGSGKTGRDAVVRGWREDRITSANGKIYFDGVQTTPAQISRYYLSQENN